MGRLFWKIFAGIWLTLVLTVLGVGTAFVIHNKARFEEADRLARDPRSAFVSRMFALSIARGGEELTREMLADWPSYESAPPLVVSNDGKDLIGRPVPAGAYAQALEQAKRPVGKREADDDREPGPGPGRLGFFRSSTRAVQSPSGERFLVFLPAELGRPPRPHLGPEYPAALFVAALIASLIVSALLARNFTRPIGRLRDAFHAVAAGKLDTRVAPGTFARKDEIGELGRDFDAMAHHLEKLVASRDRLLHDVSHELRSPLARLQVAVGLAEQQPERVQIAFERIRREAERLDALVGEVLTLARLESAGSTPIQEEYIDLRELLASVVDDARFEAEGSGRSIVFSDDLEQDIVIRARGGLLHRAFDNVVRNALQHSPDDGRVELSLSVNKASDQLRVKIGDQGPGVAEAQLPAIFEPFFRADSSGSGYGLGLAIARRAIEAHGGTISAHNREPHGLEIRIELPLSTAMQAPADHVGT